METQEKTTRRLRPLLPLLPPVLLSLLFYLFRGRQALMDGWVIHVMAPAEQLLGRLSAPLPFSRRHHGGKVADVVHGVVVLCEHPIPPASGVPALEPEFP